MFRYENKKSELRDFVQNKADSRKKEIRQSATLIVEAVVKPVVLQVYDDLALLEREAQRLHDRLLEAAEKHKRFNNWSIKSIVRDLDSHVIGVREDLANRQVRLVLMNLFDFQTEVTMPEVEELIPSIALELTEKVKEYRDVTDLRTELTAIIDSSHNGDKAFSRLEELGVDLTGFDKGSDNLPAVIALSVNPCVLNGSCG
ncbi:hypothetical protein DFQ01_1449 [Paenibacillus cellulosilyticus]|uniref:Uncharacterized protein n=1 Tax=Paenibacillus cellulosilyticus TaxID=375489 RepID=A0A2V2YN05_9BACL|nr:hypothetical protein [Paenibacillus cellulosilyticus]PWV90233.1 hypothetical protein DFQ01_1449 [Paenibacillus cellulosilyticus]QKS43392.1 hypothetical protein HUB94_02405 [Paenibacillus cellulosilyticus]